MTYLPRNLPALLRAAGLTVVEVDGWETRGRPASTGGFDPTGVLNHHTGASAAGWSLAKELTYAKWMFLTGRPSDGLPAPLVQIALGRSGVVYIGAAGRANHAGTAKASGSVSGGDGNALYAGIEWMLSGTEDIPAEMMQAAITLNAVLTEEVTKTSVETISCHYNTSVTGKWDIGDPNGVQYGDKRVLDVPKFRKAVRARRDNLYSPERPVRPAPAGAEYAWFQQGKIGEPSSGCALGVRAGFGSTQELSAHVGSAATREGGGIGTRTILRARVLTTGVKMTFSTMAGHAPPPRAPKARAAFMKVFTGLNARFKGGDLNLRARAVARLFGCHVVGNGVLWLTVPRKGWKVISVRPVNVDGDHKAVLARVQNLRTGRVVKFLVVNCMSVSTGPKHAASILANGLSFKPDVVLASECSDFRAAEVH